jgi:hypothetical protein
MLAGATFAPDPAYARVSGLLGRTRYIQIRLDCYNRTLSINTLVPPMEAIRPSADASNGLLSLLFGGRSAA